MEYYTPKQLAVEFGVTPRTILNWVTEGVFPGAFKVRKRTIRVPSCDVEALKKNQANEAS